MENTDDLETAALVTTTEDIADPMSDLSTGLATLSDQMSDVADGLAAFGEASDATAGDGPTASRVARRTMADDRFK